MHAIPIALVAAALAAAGCGGGGDGETTGGGSSGGGASTTQTQEPAATQSTTTTQGADGAKVFASAGCGSCHTFKAAGTSGNVGPNLDDLAPDVATVQSQVENGGGGMPAFGGDLSQAEIDAVARYVADNAGQ